MEDPVLKFSQICLQETGQCSDNNFITSIVMGVDNLLVFSTSNGSLFGSSINGQIKFEYPKANAYITSLSTNLKGTHILSSSSDGNLNLYQINNKKPVYSYRHSSNIFFCALDPDYSSEKRISLVFADSSGVHMLSQGIVFTSPKLLYEDNDPPVKNLKWINGFVIWTTSKTIKIRNLNQKDEKFTHNVFPPKQNYVKSENTSAEQILSNPKTSIVPINTETIVISFGHYIYEFRIDKNRILMFNTVNPVISLSYSSLATLRLQYSTKQSDYQIIVEQCHGTSQSKTPETIKKSDLSAFFCSTRNSDEFILALPNKIYLVGFSTLTTRIQTMLDWGDESMCIEKLKMLSATITDEDLIDLTISIASHFISKNVIIKAAEICATFLKPIPSHWEKAIEFFLENSILSYLVTYIPIDKMLGNTPHLTKVLLELLETNSRIFCQVFSYLPNASFDTNELINGARKKAQIELVYNIPLMHLYHLMGHHDSAFECARIANYLQIFHDIETYGSYNYCITRFDELFSTYGNLFTRFLLTHKANTELPVDTVISKFESNFKKLKSYMFDYLHSLRMEGYSIHQKYETTLANLYIHHHHPLTMEFLKSHSNFDYLDIFKTAKEEKMYREAAFLARKSGSSLDGMKIFIQYIKIPIEIVEYAMKLKLSDSDVWNELFQESYKNPELLKCILENLASLKLDIVTFMNGIPKEMERKINMKESAQDTIKEFERRMKTAKLTEEIVADSAFNKLCIQIATHKKCRIVMIK